MHLGRSRRKTGSDCRRTAHHAPPACDPAQTGWPYARSRRLKLTPPAGNMATAGTRLPDRSAKNPATVLICLLSAMSFPGLAAAAEWSLESSIGLALGHDDNPTLTTAPHEKVSEVSVVPRIKWSKATEASAVNLDLSLNATRYSGSEVPDSNEGRLSLTSFLQTTERTRWGLDGELRRDTLFETIQTTPGTGNLQDTDVGLVSQSVRRDWRAARPSWRYALSERSAIGLSYGITDVGFSNIGATGLVDYKNHQLSATYSRNITVKNDLNITVNRFAYRPDQARTKSDTTQLLAGIVHAYSETARGRFLAGVGKTSETTPTGTDNNSGFVLEAGMTQRSELTTLDGVISRDVQPSGIGRSVMSNQFRMYLARKISPMVDLVLRAKAFRNEVLEGSDPTVDRRFYGLTAGLNWYWKPAWTFAAEYDYTRQKFDADPKTAESRAVFVSVTYAWPRLVASR